MDKESDIFLKREQEPRVEEFKEFLRFPLDDRFDVVANRKIIPLNYYPWSKSEIEIKIEDFGKTVLDFSKDIIRSHQEENEIQFYSEFDVDNSSPNADLESFSINLDGIDWEDPREIFVVLHEIGHLKSFLKKGDRKHYSREVANLSSEEDEELIFARAKIESERNAWAEAIRIARTIKQNQGANLFKVFENSKDLKNWLRERGLDSHREVLEKSLIVKKWLADQKDDLASFIEKNYSNVFKK